MPSPAGTTPGGTTAGTACWASPGSAWSTRSTRRSCAGCCRWPARSPSPSRSRSSPAACPPAAWRASPGCSSSRRRPPCRASWPIWGRTPFSCERGAAKGNWGTSLFEAHGLADRADGAHLDAADGGRRDLRGDLDRFVEVARLDHVAAGQAFLGLGERPVGDRQPAVAHAHGGGGGHRLQRFGGDAVAAGADALVERDAVAVVHRLDGALLPVNQAEVLHGLIVPILRCRSTAALSPKSSSSKYSRTSIWPSPPSIDGLGKLRVHSIASSRDSTLITV